MTGFADSTIAAMFFANPTDIDFPRLADELGRALWGNPQGQLDIHSAYDDFVVYDLATMRISLAYTNLADAGFCDATPCMLAESIVVAIGPGANGYPPGPGFEDRAALCQGLVERITQHQRADRMIVREHHGLFDEDAHDALIEEIANSRGQTLAGRPDPVTEDLMWEMASRAWDSTEEAPEEIAEPPQRVRPARPTHPAAAADTRGEAAQAKAAGFRLSRLWDPDVERQPLAHRAAVNGLNAAMLVFALPVGAALMTLAVLGRESLGVSTRMTALTGSALSLSQTEAAQSLLTYFS